MQTHWLWRFDCNCYSSLLDTSKLGLSRDCIGMKVVPSGLNIVWDNKFYNEMEDLFNFSTLNFKCKICVRITSTQSKREVVLEQCNNQVWYQNSISRNVYNLPSQPL